MTVKWHAPASGRVEQYEIQLKSETGTKQSTTTSTETTFANLTPGISYTVLMVSVSGEQRSGTAEKTFFTSKYVVI